MAFEFATATRIIFGAGKIAEAKSVLGAARVLVVSGKNRARAERLGLASAVPFSVSGEPTVGVVREGVRLAKGCDAVVAIGGGSALDAGKAIAVLATNGGDPLDYLEVIGKGRALEKPSLPFVAIPTTAGTGSEVTKNAVLADPDARVKASLRSPHMLPKVAIVDPDLLEGAPREVLASSGLDALSQLLEPFLSARRNPMTDALAREGIRRSLRSLRRAVLEGADASAREDLALASLLGGMCLANAGLGAVHGFAAPIGGSFDAPHGAVCAALLHAVLDANYRAARSASDADLLERFDELGGEEFIVRIGALVRELGVPGLSHWGMREADVPAMVAKAKVASSMKANPFVLSDDELTQILMRSL